FRLRPGEQPTPPLAVEEVDLAHPPALVHEPEALAVFVQLEQSVRRGEGASRGGQVAHHVRLFVWTDDAVYGDEAGRPVSDREGPEHPPDLRPQPRHET